MRKISKFVSIVVALSTLLMVMILPTTAAPADDGYAKLWLTKELKAGTDNIYKVTLHLDANYPVSVGDIRIYYKKSDFKLIRNTGVADTSVSARNAVTWLGSFANEDESAETASPDGYVLGPGAADKAAVVNVTAKYFNDVITQDLYGALQIYWITGSENHYYYDSSVYGDQVAEFYLQKLDGVSADAIKEVGMLKDAPKQDVAWTGLAGDVDAAKEIWNAAGSTTSFKTIEIVEEQADSSIIHPMSSQIRFKGVKTEADFAAYNELVGDAKTFDVRTRATIAKADFLALFGGEGATEAEAQAAAEAAATNKDTGIQDFGFIYRANKSKDDPNYAAFDYDTAVAAAKGESTDATYVKQPCTYMQRTAEGYNFTCLISGIVDNAEERANGVTCVAYVFYNGNYYFFDKADVVTVTYDDLYNMWHK